MLTTEPIKGQGKNMHGKQKTYKECIRTNFQGKNGSYDMYCNVTAVLKTESV